MRTDSLVYSGFGGKVFNYIKHHNGKPVPFGFHYSSDCNEFWETPETMREKIKKYVDPNFEVK